MLKPTLPLALFALSASCSQIENEQVNETSSASSDRDHIVPVGPWPFRNGGYVVQGVASNCEGMTTCESEEVVYLSMYYKSEDGEVATESQHAEKTSRVVAMSANTGELLKCYSLAGEAKYAHVGGLAFFGGSLYVTGGGKIERYELPEKVLAKGCSPLSPSGAWDVDHEAFVSYAAVDGADYLFTGRYCTDADDCAPYLYQYELDSLGNLKAEGSTTSIGKSAVYWSKSSGTAELVNKYALPYSAQGAAIIQIDGHDPKLITASSNGNSPGKLSKYNLQDNLCSADRECGLQDPIAKNLSLPTGAEDLAYAGGKYWNASESAAQYYDQYWDEYYPYVYYVDVSKMWN